MSGARRALHAYGTAEERREIAARADAHEVSTSRFLIQQALSRPPVPTAAVEAEEWWARLPTRRKRQIHGFLAAQARAECQVAGQLTIGDDA